MKIAVSRVTCEFEFHHTTQSLTISLTSTASPIQGQSSRRVLPVALSDAAVGTPAWIPEAWTVAQSLVPDARGRAYVSPLHESVHVFFLVSGSRTVLVTDVRLFRKVTLS